MKRTVVFVLLILSLALAGCGLQTFGDGNTIRGSGKLASETRSVSGFTRIAVQTAGWVKVTRGDTDALVIEAEGSDYLMLFDTRERLNTWAQAEVDFVEVPGHVVAANTMPPLQWALNVGTEYSKRFLSEEIAWLKDVVAQCEAAIHEDTQESL